MEKYGKFDSAEELLKGYNELEKSFTQKCQQLAQLEKSVSEQTSQPRGTSDEVATSASPQDEITANGVASSVANDATAVPSRQSTDVSVEDRPYATSVPPRIMTGGGNVSAAMPNRPKTLKEASELAKKYFN